MMERRGMMPKTNINDEVTLGMRVEVAWGHDSTVQVGTTNEHSDLVLQNTDSDGDMWTEPFYGWFVTLDRHGVNRLIQALRKARDAAYGADA